MYKTELEKFEEKFNEKENPFRCSICKNYLSVAPIYVNATFGNICGRKSCEKFAKTDGTLRQNAYEAFAMSIEFPCCNKENGCDQILPWDEIESHEEVCEFGCLLCPFSHKKFKNSDGKSCEWKGDTSEFLEHMLDYHPGCEFKNSFLMDIDDPIKNNQVLFSDVNGEIFIILVLVDSYSVSHWRGWAGSDITNDLKYRLVFNSETGEILMSSKYKIATPINSAFYKTKVDDSWFHFDLGNFRNLFESFSTLAIDLNVNDFPLDQPTISAPLDVPIFKYRKCLECKNTVKGAPFVCSQSLYHTFCQSCVEKEKVYCRSCKNHPKIDVSSVCLKSAADQSLIMCPVCDLETDSLLFHLRQTHEKSLLKLGKCYRVLVSNRYFFYYDNHLFLFSATVFADELIFSVKCFESYYFKYKYELTLTCSKSDFSGITFRGFCYPELVYRSIEGSNNTNNKIKIPAELLSNFFIDVDFIEFKMIITTI